MPTQAAGDSHTALWCCSALPKAPILPEAPTHHDQRSPTDSRSLLEAGGQLGTVPAEALGPLLTPPGCPWS